MKNLMRSQTRLLTKGTEDPTGILEWTKQERDAPLGVSKIIVVLGRNSEQCLLAKPGISKRRFPLSFQLAGCILSMEPVIR
jgi:hypothetical protein